MKIENISKRNTIRILNESSEPNSETLLEMARINILQTERMRVPNGFKYTGSFNPLKKSQDCEDFRKIDRKNCEDFRKNRAKNFEVDIYCIIFASIDIHNNWETPALSFAIFYELTPLER